jgi:hypothetical protein
MPFKPYALSNCFYYSLCASWSKCGTRLCTRCTKHVTGPNPPQLKAPRRVHSRLAMTQSYPVHAVFSRPSEDTFSRKFETRSRPRTSSVRLVGRRSLHR